jgi:mono/diheme cytochrome c family protein
MKNRLAQTGLLILLSACSRDYAPQAEIKAEQIFQTACRECHEPARNGSIFSLKPPQANIDYIAKKIRYGSWLMPSFPKMSNENLIKIADYVWHYSDIAEE